MPIISLYLDEELFQRLEKARGIIARSPFAVSILNEKLNSMEDPGAIGSEKPVEPEDPFEELKNQQKRLEELHIIEKDQEKLREYAQNLFDNPKLCKRYKIDDLPRDPEVWDSKQSSRFWTTVYKRLSNEISATEAKVEDYQFDGIRHQQCLRLVNMSLKKLRGIYNKFYDENDRDPTIQEFASWVAVTYQKARSLAPLLGREYGIITEAERQRIEKEFVIGRP